MAIAFLPPSSGISHILVVSDLYGLPGSVELNRFGKSLRFQKEWLRGVGDPAIEHFEVPGAKLESIASRAKRINNIQLHQIFQTRLDTKNRELAQRANMVVRPFKATA